MFKISKVISLIISILIIQIFITTFVSAQNIDAVLGSKDSSSAIQVTNSEGENVISFGSNGSAIFRKFGNVRTTNQVQINTPNYLLFMDGRSQFGWTSNRHIYLMSGGNITLNTPVGGIGNLGGARIEVYSGSSGGGINILGGSHEDGFVGHGKILIKPGDGNVLELFGGGYGATYGEKGGDVNIRGGGYSSSVNISTPQAYSGLDAGDVNITGGYSSEDRGGDIIITPGLTGTSEPGEDGQLILNGSGTYSGTWTQASDKRFKKNINKIYDPTEKLQKLEPVTYELRKDEFPDKHFEVGEQIGLIAQDVEKLFPQLVKNDEDGYMTIDYTKLSVLLLATVKNQQKEIEELNLIVNKILSESYQLSLGENND